MCKARFTLHTGYKVEFNTVNFVESGQSRPWRFDPLCPLATKSTIADESATVDLVARQCVLGVSCLVSCIFQLCGVLVII